MSFSPWYAVEHSDVHSAARQVQKRNVDAETPGNLNAETPRTLAGRLEIAEIFEGWEGRKGLDGLRVRCMVRRVGRTIRENRHFCSATSATSASLR